MPIWPADRSRPLRVDQVTDRSVSPDRTLVALKESGAPCRIAAWRLDRSGRVAGRHGCRSLAGDEPESWNILGWAGPTRPALWRRRDGHSQLRVVDLADDAANGISCQVIGCQVIGRPVQCRLVSGRLVVLAAVSQGGRPLLCLHDPDTGSYLPIDVPGRFRGVAAWDTQRRIVIATADTGHGSTGVYLCGYGPDGDVQVEAFRPGGIAATSAAGCGGDIVGLTGAPPAGPAVPGVFDLASRTVRWFDAHPGYSCTEVSPSGRRVLAGAWDGQEFAYRVFDADGTRLADLDSGSGIATELCFSSDERHIVGWHQSPATPPELACWSVPSGRRHPGPRRPRIMPLAGISDMRWYLRWVPGTGGDLPEWVFRPVPSRDAGTVVYLHGGPRGRLNQGYEPVIAALVEAGWTVIGMNYPGSSGYGLEYQESTRGDWGGADAAAIEARVRALHAEAHGRPLCLYGHSYGAYLALLVASEVPQLLDGVAVWAPVTDLPGLLSAARGTRLTWLEEELGDRLGDPGWLLARSPVGRLPGLAGTQLLVGHGRHDDKCPVEQSRRLVALLWDELSAAGSVRYQEDPDSSHAPARWRWWTDAVTAHFQQVSAPRLPMVPAGQVRR